VYLNVQMAARTLGVSPHTVRRWTTSGFLPCSRTPGGHRRFQQEDIAELARLLGGSNHRAARRARERELDTLLDTSTALVSQLELPDLLEEIARQLTRLMDCGFCAISAFDEKAQTVTTLADYDDRGERLPDSAAEEAYDLARYPLTRRVLEEHTTAVVNLSDPAADPAELSELRRDDDKSLLMVPLVYGCRSIGLLELMDHSRERRYSRQELRLCTAIASQGAVALHNAEAFSDVRHAENGSDALRFAIEEAARQVVRLDQPTDVDALLRAVAEIACRICDCAMCVVEGAGTSAGVGGLSFASHGAAVSAMQPGPGAVSGAQLLVASDPSGRTGLRLTVSLLRAPYAGESELLSLLAAAAGSRLLRLSASE
jgi:excisionase family DNA binding protein